MIGTRLAIKYFDVGMEQRRRLSDAILAFGGNLGNVADAFEQGLRKLEDQNVKVSRIV